MSQDWQEIEDEGYSENYEIIMTYVLLLNLSFFFHRKFIFGQPTPSSKCTFSIGGSVVSSTASVRETVAYA